MKSTLPSTRAQAEILKRSRLISDTEWTPLLDIRSHPIKDPENPNYHKAGVTVKGMPYSSVEAVDKFIGENVSFYTFISALDNPDSVLYNRDLIGFKNASGYYGCVCNETVRHAIGIPQRYNTFHWYEMPGMNKVADAGEYTADMIELCDVLHYNSGKGGHVALITDILCDDDDNIVAIEVSEASTPRCKRASYPLEEYFKKFDKFSLCRYEYLDDMPDNDPEETALLTSERATKRTIPSIAQWFGDKANCLEDEDVVISVFSHTPCDAEISCDGEVIETVHFDEPGRITRRFWSGAYTIRHSVTGEETLLNVNKAIVGYRIDGDTITITSDTMDDESELIYFDFRTAGEKIGTLIEVVHLTPEEQASGKFSHKIPEKAGNIKLYYRNAFGIWSSGLVHLV
nr:hypothetical protein [Clostridia bacterium]